MMLDKGASEVVKGCQYGLDLLSTTLMGLPQVRNVDQSR